MKRVEFKAPEGFSVPEGKQAGDTFEEVGTFKIKPDGTLCLVEIGDVKLLGYDDKDGDSEYPQDKVPTSKGYVDNMMGMAGGMGES